MPPRWLDQAPTAQVDVIQIQFIAQMEAILHTEQAMSEFSRVCVVMAGLTCGALTSQWPTDVRPPLAPESNQSDPGRVSVGAFTWTIFIRNEPFSFGMNVHSE